MAGGWLLHAALRGVCKRAVMGDPGRKRRRVLSVGGEASPWRRTFPRLETIVEPNDAEAKLFKTLNEVVGKFDTGTTVRVAGGWVRDKLIGRDSHDIDIALDNMTGEEFAKLVNRHLDECGEKTHRIGVIVANPEQSKHLATATLNVLGVNVDFVNLRSEEYQDSSRIPQSTRFGTAVQDAERRDFTINSLFYNVNCGALEDLTNLGVDDLKNGVIRTPLPPTQTFRDDPLRMLRAVRFASRYGFILHDDIQAALTDKENLGALSAKVSRERIGLELQNMLRGANPDYAIDLLVNYALAPVVFAIIDPPPVANSDGSKRKRYGGSLSHLSPEEAEQLLSQQDEAILEAKRKMSTLDWHSRAEIAKAIVSQTKTLFDTDRYIQERKDITPETLFLAALLHSLDTYSTANYKHKLEPLTSCIVRDSLKFKAAIAENVKTIVHAVPVLLALASHLGDQDEDAIRKQTGHLMLRSKELFHVSLCLATLVQPDARPGLEMLFDFAVRKWGLSELWREGQIFNGKDLLRELGMKKGGPMIGSFMQLQNDWIIMNRTEHFFGDKDLRRKKCSEFLLAHKDEVFEQEQVRQKKAGEEKEREIMMRKQRKELARKAKEEEQDIIQ